MSITCYSPIAGPPLPPPTPPPQTELLPGLQSIPDMSYSSIPN